MTKRHELHVYDYVTKPYDAVRDTLVTRPLTVFRNATTGKTTTTNAELHTHVGGVAVDAEITIHVLGVADARSPDDHPATKLSLEWRAAHRPRWFPTMRAELLVYALTATETQLDLVGTYDPPFGVLGDAIDAVAMHRVAEESVSELIREVAQYLRAA